MSRKMRRTMEVMVARALEKRAAVARQAKRERDASAEEEGRRRTMAIEAGRAWADMTARYRRPTPGSAWPFPATTEPPIGLAHAYRVYTWTPELVAIAHAAARERWNELTDRASEILDGAPKRRTVPPVAFMTEEPGVSVSLSGQRRRAPR